MLPWITSTPWLRFCPPEATEPLPEPMPPGRVTHLAVPRKIRQVIDRSDFDGPLALADDGTLWQWRKDLGNWSKIKPLPDREEEL